MFTIFLRLYFCLLNDYLKKGISRLSNLSYQNLVTFRHEPNLTWPCNLSNLKRAVSLVPSCRGVLSLDVVVSINRATKFHNLLQCQWLWNLSKIFLSIPSYFNPLTKKNKHPVFAQVNKVILTSESHPSDFIRIPRDELLFVTHS